MSKAHRSASEVERRHIVLLERLARHLEQREEKPDIVMREIRALYWAVNKLKGEQE